MIKSLVGTDAEFSRHQFNMPGELKTTITGQVKQDFWRDTLAMWRITRDGQVVAYAVMDDVLGKHMPITFLVLFDPGGVITDCRVVKYRERYGKGIKHKRCHHFSGLRNQRN
ncbi:MAG: hypothetical protein GY940_05500 [bacterium]|nr:hypothetical protein [bacterium]